MNWHLFQQNNSHLSTEEAYRQFRSLEDSQLQEAVINRGTRMGAATPSAIISMGGKQRKLKGLMMKVTGAQAGFGIETIKPATAVINWGDGISEVKNFTDEVAYLDCEHTYVDGLANHVITVEIDPTAVLEFYGGYYRETTEYSSFEDFTSLNGVDLRGYFSKFPKMPDSATYANYANCSDTEPPSMGPNMTDISISGANLSFESHNYMIETAIYHGKTNGRIYLDPVPTIRYAMELWNMKNTLVNGRSWQINIPDPVAVSWTRRAPANNQIVIVTFTDMLIETGNYLDGFSFTINGEPITATFEGFYGNAINFGFGRALLTEDVLLMSYNENTGVIRREYENLALKSFSNYRLDTEEFTQNSE